MMNVFYSMESKLDETLKQNKILKDRLLEATLADDVQSLVMHSYVEIENKNSRDESERFSKELKDVSNESKTIDSFCNDAFDVKEELSKRILENTLAQQTKDFDDVKFELSNKTAKFKVYFEKLENTKVVLERQLARKVDDSKAKKDQLLKEINLLRTQLENMKGKFVETKFDKPSILGKPPADKLLIKSQHQKSWFDPKVVVQ
ncbi:hypothetical protein Tco_0674599 [Tanacetum coccineum]